jgi:hypothetical protein
MQKAAGMFVKIVLLFLVKRQCVISEEVALGYFF